MSRLSSRRLIEVHLEWVTFCTVEPPQVVLVVTRLSVGQRRISGVDDDDEVAQMRPLVETQCHSFLGRLDFTVLRVIGLEPFSEVDALVAGCYTYIVTSTDVLKILDTAIVFLQSVDVVAYVAYSLTKCSPSVTHIHQVYFRC